MGVIWSSVVRFWRRMSVFETETDWNREIPCKILKLTNQMPFLFLNCLWFSSFQYIWKLKRHHWKYLEKRNKKIYLLRVICSSVVRFWRRALAFEVEIPCKLLKSTDKMAFFLLTSPWFSSFNQTCYQR